MHASRAILSPHSTNGVAWLRAPKPPNGAELAVLAALEDVWTFGGHSETTCLFFLVEMRKSFPVEEIEKH